MTRILSKLNATSTTKAYETGNYLYFNGVAHNKGDMSTIPFIPFTDGGGYSNMGFSDMLVTKLKPKYWNGVQRNNLLINTSNANEYYVMLSNRGIGDNSYYVNNLHISKIIEKEETKGITGFSYDNNSRNYRYVGGATGFLGSDASYFYTIFCESTYGSSNQSSSNGYPPTNVGYPLLAILTYGGKTSGTFTKITQFSNSSGSFKILKETPTNIYFLIEKNGYQYDLCNLTKDSRQVTIMSTFSALTDNLYTNSSSGGVIASDPIKLSEDVFETYISGQLTITGQDGGATTYKNVISKVIINVETSEIEIKQIELDIEPSFRHQLAINYNNIYVIEKNNKRFLITSSHVPYQITLNPEDTIVQVYELDENDADNLRGTLTQEIKQREIGGVFHGMLQAKSNNLFMAITSKSTIAFKFVVSDKKFKTLDLGTESYIVGKDTNDNFFVMNTLYEVDIFNDENLYNLKLEMPTDDFTYENADIETTIKISAKDVQDEYMNLQVRLVITGNAKFKNEDAQAIITNTETTGVKEIPIVITGGGNVKITPFVKL